MSVPRTVAAGVEESGGWAEHAFLTTLHSPLSTHALFANTPVEPDLVGGAVGRHGMCGCLAWMMHSGGSDGPSWPSAAQARPVQVTDLSGRRVLSDGAIGNGRTGRHGFGARETRAPAVYGSASRPPSTCRPIDRPRERVGAAALRNLGGRRGAGDREFFFALCCRDGSSAAIRLRRRIPTLWRLSPNGVGPILLTSVLFASMHFRSKRRNSTHVFWSFYWRAMPLLAC